MFKSLKSFVNIPVQIKPFDKRTGTGSKVFKSPVLAMCYPEGKVVSITDTTGAEIVSNTQLYFDGTTQISILDNIVFEGRELQIKNISTFYKNGSIDLRVVYL